jgi:hypothetical protein
MMLFQTQAHCWAVRHMMMHLALTIKIVSWQPIAIFVEPANQAT